MAKALLKTTQGATPSKAVGCNLRTVIGPALVNLISILAKVTRRVLGVT